MSDTESILLAAKRMAEKLFDDHLRSGEPMIIAPDRTRLQWIMPQPDGTFKVLREEVIKPA